MKKKKSIEEDSVKEKSMFDMLNGIYTNQSIDFFISLSDVEKKKYRSYRFIMNRFISMTPEYIPVVNEVQKYQTIPDKYHYMFFANILPKKKTYAKYIKSESDSSNSDDVKLVARHFKISERESIDYLKIMKNDVEFINNLRKMYGI